MPRFTFTQALTANQQAYRPLQNWQYSRNPYPRAAVSVLIDATTTGAVVGVYSGSQTIQERSPIQTGGTAGLMPSPLTCTPVTWTAGPLDKLDVVIDETAGGTPTINGVVEIEPY